MKSLLVALLAVVAMLAAGCTPTASVSPPPAAVKDKLKLPGVLAYELNLPSLVAVGKDYFGQQNIEIEGFVLGSGATVRNAVIAGEYDFGLFNFVHVPIARQANSPWKMIVTTYEHELFSLIVRRDLQAEVDTVADLRGKRVGYSTPGSGAWAGAIEYLTRGGLDPERDVEMVSLGGDAAVLYAALQSGKVDALVAWEPTTTRALTAGVAFPLISAADENDVMISEGLVTREDIIQTKPDVVRRMVAAHRQGLEFIAANSAETIADVVLSNPMTQQQFEGLERPMVVQIIDKIKPGFGSGCLSRAGFQTAMDESVQYQLVKAPITFDQFADQTWAGECQTTTARQP